MVLVVAGVVLLVALAVQAGILRWAAMAVAGEEVDWTVATIVVVIGGIATGLANCAFGGLGGLVGALVVFLVDAVVYGGVIAALTSIDFGRAIAVGVVTSIVSAVMYFALGLGLVAMLLASQAG